MGGSHSNPSDLGGRDQDDRGPKPALANSKRDPISKIPNTLPQKSTCLTSMRPSVQTPIL
jgi:hypothetical protein